MGLAKREGRTNVTAHVYINNVPGIIAYTLSIMLPVYLQTHDQELAWRVGAAAVVWTGIIKLVAAPLRRRNPPIHSQARHDDGVRRGHVHVSRHGPACSASSISRSWESSRSPSSRLRCWPTFRSRNGEFLRSWSRGSCRSPSDCPSATFIPRGSGFSVQLPFVRTPGLLQAMGLAIPYLSVIAPMSIYQVLQDIASVEGANSAGDNYDARLIVACDGLGTFLCGVGGQHHHSGVAALHPPYKMMGARIGFCFWTGIIFLAVFMSGISLFIAQLFPWAILAAMIALRGHRRGPRHAASRGSKIFERDAAGIGPAAGAVVGSAVSSALPALKLSTQNPEVVRPR